MYICVCVSECLCVNTFYTMCAFGYPDLIQRKRHIIERLYKSNAHKSTKRGIRFFDK